MRTLTVVVMLLFIALPAFAQVDYTKTTVTRWAGPGEPGSYAEYRAAHPYEAARWKEMERRYSEATDQTGPVLVVMQTNLQGPLTGYIDTYLTDLTNDGWDPILITFSGSEPADLKAVISDYYYSDDIMGAVLVGDLPVAWFELYEDFDNDGLPDSPYQVQFPCDLYYMDLDGGWYDGDVDGILDTHTFTWEPEIFIGQLIASPLGNEIDLLQNYFDKNHAFRTGAITLPGRGLAYIDDDWSGSGPQWGGALALATGIADMIYEPDSTTAADYLDRLDDGYYAILLCAHSSPQLHQIHEQGGTVYINVYNYQIQEADPHAFFYNLFNCSGARYTENGYIGGWYVFGATYGVSGLGSTKTGSMLYFEDFYGVIEEGECVGEAFRQWFALHGQEPGSVMWAMSWFYGMTHLGDPTLFMKVGVEITGVEVIDDGTMGSSGDGDGIPDAGETVALSLTLQNNDQQPHDDLSVKLNALSSHVTWLEDSVMVGTLPASGTIQAEGFLLQIDSDTPDDTELAVSAQITNPSSLWGDNFDLYLRAPRLELISYELTELHGNGSDYIDPGETWSITLTIQNSGGDESDPGSVTLATTSLYVQPEVLVSGLGSIDPGSMAVSDPAIGIQVDPVCPSDHSAVIKAHLELSLGVTEDHFFLIQVGDQLNWLNEISDQEEVCVHYNIAESYFDQWHVEDYRSYSADYSWKFGGPDQGVYWPMTDGALELPLLKLGDGAELRFQHWIEAESGYDGGVVEVNTGDGWEAIEPEGGYPGNTVSNGSFPGGPGYNGSFDWQEAVFDLQAYVPFAKLRFRFGSDGGVHEEGWYIDDIQLTGDIYSAAPQLQLNPVHGIQFSLGPNPFNPTTVLSYQLSVSSRINLSVYDISGREVATLVDGWRDAGSHSVTFDGSDLASGIYFCRLETSETVQTRKMVLVK